ALQRIVEIEDKVAGELPNLAEAPLRSQAFECRAPRIPSRHQGTRDECECHEECCRNARLMPCDELSRPIPKCALTRLNRQSIEITPDIFGKMLRRGIPALRFLPDRLQDDCVEIGVPGR